MTMTPESDSDSSTTANSMKKKKAEKKKPTKYVALWDYQKSSAAEISFRKGDNFKEMGEECDAGPDWLFVTLTKSKTKATGTGYIPRDYVAIIGTVNAEPYYFGELTRKEASNLLFDNPDGKFIIRKRKESEGEVPTATHALAIAYQSTVKHYKIYDELAGRNMRHYLGKKKFNNINDLVRYFRCSEEGICCTLTDSPPHRPPPKRIISAEVEKNWREIPREQITIEAEIGKGFTGIVRRGVWRPTPNVQLQVAVKEFRQLTVGNREEFLAEAVAMKTLVHENLVKLHRVVSAEEPFWIIIEFVKDGSLKSYLKQRSKENRPLQETNLVDIAHQVASGMEYLEDKRVVHRDLAARNVLIQELPANTQVDGMEKFRVKIADFGLAKIALGGGSVRESQSVYVATKWTASEALLEGRFSSASDVWSFGILLYEIFTHGKEPYAGMTTEQTGREEATGTES